MNAPRLFVWLPELGKYVPVKTPGTAWDLQFWRAILKAEGKCTLLAHMASVPHLALPRYRITVRAA